MRVKRIGLTLLVALIGAHAEEAAKVEYKPLAIGALYEFGMLKEGRYGQWPAFKSDWMDHFGTFLTQSVLIGENLSMNVGLGGLFEYRKPQNALPTWGGSQFKSFFVGPTVADINYKSASEGSSWSLGAGMFNYKYNPDAANLGEYLFRTGAYPNYIMTGGYALVNNAAAYGLQGLKSNFTVGGFSIDGFVLTETGLAPLYDLSIAALAKYATPNGFVNASFGVNLKRIIPVRPSVTTRKTARNSYLNRGGKYFSGDNLYYREQADFYQRMVDTAAKYSRDTVAFVGLRNLNKSYSDSLNPADQDPNNIIAGLGAWLDSTTNLPNGAKFYTVSGTIVTAALSLDFKKLFSSDVFGANDLRLFGEAALLGIKDYPVFYEKKSKRMPMMVGFNFPSFKVLDLFSLQYEYYNSPWINSFYNQANDNTAIPYYPVGSDAFNSVNGYNDLSSHDNYSWSVLIQKQMLKGLSVNFQIGRDHIRSVGLQTYTGPQLDPNELLSKSKSWYGMLQFGMGI